MPMSTRVPVPWCPYHVSMPVCVPVPQCPRCRARVSLCHASPPRVRMCRDPNPAYRASTGPCSHLPRLCRRPSFPVHLRGALGPSLCASLASTAVFSSNNTHTRLNPRSGVGGRRGEKYDDPKLPS